MYLYLYLSHNWLLSTEHRLFQLVDFGLQINILLPIHHLLYCDREKAYNIAFSFLFKAINRPQQLKLYSLSLVLFVERKEYIAELFPSKKEEPIISYTMLSTSLPYNILSHYRSQSDTTCSRSQSSLLYRMSEPRCANNEKVYNGANSLNKFENQKKRKLNDVEYFDKTFTSPQNFCYSKNNGTFPRSKRAKTAPSSPIPYSPLRGYNPPSTPKLRLPELPLTPPSTTVNSSLANIDLTSSSNGHSNVRSEKAAIMHSVSSSQSPATPPPSTESSPKKSRRPTNLHKEAELRVDTSIPPYQSSAYYYPDTCYSFCLLDRSMPIAGVNERAYLLEQQNREWRDYYRYEVSHRNSRLYRKYRNYCENLRGLEARYIPRVTPLKFDPLLPNASKLSTFVNNQYNRFDGLVNYPYASNYNYQSTGYMQDVNMLTNSPELYRSQTRKGFSFKGDYEDPRCKLPPLKHILGRNKFDENEEEGLQKDQSYSRRSPIPFAHHSKERETTPKPSTVVAKFINTSFKQCSNTEQAKPTTSTVIGSPGRKTKKSPTHRRHSHTLHPHRTIKKCISCHSTQSPCWRPSWAPKEGQLCNSCGLRYKKTRARCLNPKCLRIPAKGEWTLMKKRGKVDIPQFNSEGAKIGIHHNYKCLHCEGEVVVDE